jgi:tetratricopeptide (TPR) repeat protein
MPRIKFLKLRSFQLRWSSSLLLALIVAAHHSSGAQISATHKTPRVGIDTTFGDRFHAAAAAMKAERWEEVVATTSTALAMKPDPKNAAILFNWRGLAHASLANWERALADMSDAIRSDPRIEFARTNRAILWMKKGEYAQAVRDLTEDIRVHPGELDLYAIRGSAYLQLKQRERARADYQRALGMRVKNGTDYARRAKVYFYSGDYVHAAADYATAKRLKSNDNSTLNQVAWFEATCPDGAFRDGQAAVRDATRACELSKWRDPEAIDTLAVAYAEIGDFGQAVRYATQCVAMNNSSAHLRAQMQEHLHAFHENKPWREQTKL